MACTDNDDNDSKYSNVKYIYDMYLGDGKEIENNFKTRKFYQRGVGSHEDDSFTESGMGTGSGKRFDNVMFHIEKYISDYKEKADDILPTIIQLDVFGFSRGAAMARHFVNCIKQNYFDFKDSEINNVFSNHNIQINFLGVFDTVGSFGIAGDNDDIGFSFHIKPSWIESKAVHIYALNEYRWGFDLQALSKEQDSNYPINIFDEKLIEVGLPGVHSDIGGGYTMNELEQFTDNSLLACMALEVMANYAIDNKVPLDCDYKDAGRRSAAANNKSFGEVEACFNVIKPYIEDNNLRASIGLWREHIALADICQFKLDKANSDLKNLWAGEDDSVVDQHKSDVRR
jgi:exonuclease VII small subunit